MDEQKVDSEELCDRLGRAVVLHVVPHRERMALFRALNEIRARLGIGRKDDDAALERERQGNEVAIEPAEPESHGERRSS